MRPTDPASTPTDPTNDYRVPPPATCDGCGGYHGGVNAERECLRRALATTRRIVRELAAKIPAGEDQDGR